MSHYRPKIEKEKKTPSVSRVLLIGVWVVWALLVLLDLYRTFFLSGITANDIFWDAALFAVALYFSVRYGKKKK